MPTLRDALNAITDNPACFRAGFREWSGQNMAILKTVFREANRGWDAGVRKTGINLIIEHIRWETTVRDATDARFKIADQWTSSIARLYTFLWPERRDLFSFRDRGAGRVVGMPNKGKA